MDDEQLCVYTVSVNLLHKVGVKEKYRAHADHSFKWFLKSTQRKACFHLNSLSPLLPHHGETPLVTLSLC